MRQSQFAWVCGGLVMAGMLVAGVLAAEQPMHPHHVALTPDQLKWGPTPPSLPAGAELAVLDGDPSHPGPYTMRLRTKGAYTFAPHWHSQAEHATVIKGTLYVGAGDTLDKSKAAALPVGGYVSLPAKMHHFAYTEAPAVIQIHGEGPFDINYINPKDDPRQQ